MNSLIHLLSHPYLIINRVAEAVYQAEGNAINQRLRSRIKERHRFTVQDYKAIRKEALAFSRQLDRIAARLRKPQMTDKRKPDLLKRMHHPWLKHKKVLATVGEDFGLGYYALYDGLRDKVALPEGFLQALAAEYEAFAAFVRQQLEAAKQEKKAYVFSAGQGGGSHRG